MPWVKHGKIFSPDTLTWTNSHAQIPTARQINGDVYRIYFATRTEENMSRVAYVDIDINNPNELLDLANEPVLDLGELGTFDDSGVFPHWIVEREDTTYLYYTGWMRGDRVPYYAAIGQAEVDKNNNGFKRISRAPILPRSNEDHLLMHSPCVHVEEDTWRMWYSSATTWENGSDGPKPQYHIRYAESENGQDWESDGTVCIDFSSDDEWAIARPCVRKNGDEYQMWYCYSRGDQGYRIGYAESKDGISWTRQDDEVGISPDDDGWDSQMIGYPYVFAHKGNKFMLYNGSNFGENGFGLAEKVE